MWLNSYLKRFAAKGPNSQPCGTPFSKVLGDSKVSAVSADNRKKNTFRDVAVHSNFILIYFRFLLGL